MLRLPLSMLSPGGSRGRLSILIFHRVLRALDPLAPYEPDATGFEERMRWVRNWFNVLPLSDAVDRLGHGTLPPRALAITFDDGYADNAELAAPILERLGMTATFFVSTGFTQGGTMWNDRIIETIRVCRSPHLDAAAIGLGRLEIGTAALRRDAIGVVLRRIKHLERNARDAAVAAIVEAAGGEVQVALMMRPEQLRRLRARGMEIGAHTVTHPILARLDDDEARSEIAQGKRDLEALLDASVGLFAYPNGTPDEDFRREHVAMVRECGFRAAVSTSWGAASAATDRFQLPRFTPWDRSRWRYGARMLANLVQRPRESSQSPSAISTQTMTP